MQASSRSRRKTQAQGCRLQVQVQQGGGFPGSWIEVLVVELDVNVLLFKWVTKSIAAL